MKMCCTLWKAVFFATLQTQLAASNIDKKASDLNQGTIIYYARRNSVPKSQTWTFWPPNNRTDLVFFFKLQEFRWFYCGEQCYQNRATILLAGTDRENFRYRLYTYSTTPQCRTYVKASSQRESTCSNEFIPSKVCNSSVKLIDPWPPTITASFTNYGMILDYGFVECPSEYKLNPTAMPATTGYSPPQPASSNCGNENLNDSYGVVIGYSNKGPEVKCSWTFSPPDTRNPRILVLKMIEYTFYSEYSSDYRDNIFLPDGSGKNMAKRDNNSRTKPWCGMYVKNKLKNETFCQSGSALPGACDAPTTASLSWPPKLSISFYGFYMKLQYEFLECPKDYIVYPSVTSTETPEVTKTEWHLITSPLNVTTAINKHITAHHFQITSSTTMLIAICLAVILVVTIIVLAILGYRYRQLLFAEQQRKTMTTSEAQQVITTAHTENGTSANNIYAAVGPSEPTAVRYNVEGGTVEQNAPVSSQLYTMAEPEDHAEKQDVDNVLYGNVERQSVNNELYHM